MGLWKLYLMFLKIGSLMIGGGYSMLPLLIRELVERNKIITEDELTDYMAVAQCTPGVIAINTATFVGYKVRRVIGVQLVDDLFQLVIREAPDQQLLGIGLHFHEGFCRQLLGKQTKQKGYLLVFQTAEDPCDVVGIHGDEDIPQCRVFLILQHPDQRFFYDFKTLCHCVSSLQF